ncbi:MAG TPA: hypothetical protein VGU20_09630 [Stellaceae bacterium]|nr:hypothetical protein [Stellaceae bacterium]
MSFKTPLEEQCFEIARRALGTPVKIEHNRRIQIESALFPAVAAFKGPPAKEVDVIAADLIDQPKVTLLISCKEFSKRAEPAHVQEWAAVVRTMNEYSAGTVYLGLIVSPTGFTAGCEAWATSHNTALIPPLKGRNLVFSGEAVFRMLERALIALRRRALLKVDDLLAPPEFFDFVYSVVSDFEGHEEVAQEGRYLARPSGWISSFGEMYASLAGHVVEDLAAGTNGTTLWLSGGLGCRFAGARVEFGTGMQREAEPLRAPQCLKNIEGEPCTFDFVRSTVLGSRVTSAADFGDYLEFGLDERLNLSLHIAGFHLVSTESPIDQHRL